MERRRCSAGARKLLSSAAVAHPSLGPAPAPFFFLGSKEVRTAVVRGSDVNITEVAVDDRLCYCFFADYATGLYRLHQGSDCHDHFVVEKSATCSRATSMIQAGTYATHQP